MMITLKRYFFSVIVPQQLLAAAAIVYLSATENWGWLAVAWLGWFMFYVMGEGMFLHRYFSHKAFECQPWVAKFFSICAMLGGFGTPIGFRAIHLVHHANADTEKDTHSPTILGLLHGYVLWYLRPLKVEHTMLMGSRHLLKDPFYPFIEKHRIKLWWAGLVVFALIDWRIAVFAMGLGGAVGWHFTCITNSFLHRFGTRRFDTKDNSRNLWWLSWITWHGSSSLHNNHHGVPARYHDSHAWYELDVGKWIVPLIATKLPVDK